MTAPLPPTTVPARAQRSLQLAALAAVLAVLLAVVLPGSLSRAEPLPGAVVNASIRQDRVGPNESVTLDIAWRVPDGTQAGDTFTVTLPPQLRAHAGTSFDLRDRTGAVVAKADVSASAVRFTMTDYAATHISVSGSAYLALSLVGVAGPGDVDVVITAEGVAYRDTVRVVAPAPNDYSATATKWSRFVSPGPNVPAGADLMWAISAPRITSLAPITFVDTPGRGQAALCTNLVMVSGRDNLNGSPSGAAPGYAAGVHYRVTECRPDRVVVVLTPQPVHLGTVPMLLGWSSITDATLTEYTNAGSVSVGGGSVPVQTVVLSAGGQGTGTTPPVGSGTSTPPTQTSTSASQTTTTPPVGSGTSTPPTSSDTTTPPTGSATTPPGGTTSTPPIATATVTTGVPTPAPGVPTPSPATGPRGIDTGVAGAGMDGTMLLAGLGLIGACGAGLLVATRTRRR